MTILGGDPTSVTKYSKMNEKIERISKQFYVVIMGVHITQASLRFFGTAINYFIYDLGDKSFDLLFSSLWPFNWKTPAGYVIAFAIQFAADMCVQTWLVPTLSFFIALCWVSVAFAKDIASDVNILNVGGTSEQRQSESIEHFCKIVQLYGDARQLRHISRC